MGAMEELNSVVMNKTMPITKDFHPRLYPPRGTQGRDYRHYDSSMMEYIVRDPGDEVVAGGPWQKHAPSAEAE